MKQIALAAMVMMTVAGSVNASVTDDWDIFWGTTLPSVFSDLDPAKTGWNDFWYQCQDPTKHFGDCIGTVAAGVGMIAAAPIVGLTMMNSIGLFGVMAVTGSPAILASPAVLGVTAAVATV